MEKTLKNALIKSCNIIMKEDSLVGADTLVLEIEFCGECFSRKVSYVLSIINLDDDNWVVSEIGMSLIPLIMKTVYADSFDDISGKYCRIALDESGNVSDLYNIIHSDDFVNLYDSFEVYNQ